MNLLEQIFLCDSDEELNALITEKISELDNNAEKVEQIGFVGPRQDVNVFKGFIPLNARIKYESLSLATYKMDAVDFYYEFAHFLKKHNIKSKAGVISSLETFLNIYFGYPGKTSRDEIFEDIAWSTTTTDEELFAALENNSIGDLKGKGAAECTERGAVVNQLLSLFDFEVYLTIGCLNNAGREEAHCYNVVKRKNDYALLDYSVATTSYSQEGTVKGFYPFLGFVSNEDIQPFLNGDKVLSFEDYDFIDKTKIPNGKIRSYAVNQYEIKQENKEGVRKV